MAPVGFIYLFILIYFIDYAITVVPFFSPFYSPLCCTHLPPSLPHLSSSPWVIHISSLASPFPILFLTSPCQFCTYYLCFLFPVLFPTFSPLPLPSDTFHVISITVILFLFQFVCLVHFILFFCFLGSVVDSSQFVVILLFVFLMFFFFLGKAL